MAFTSSGTFKPVAFLRNTDDGIEQGNLRSPFRMARAVVLQLRAMLVMSSPFADVAVIAGKINEPQVG